MTRIASISGLEKSFRSRSIIRNLDLEVEMGTRIGLHGPNGSGKTTFLRCVAGSLLPDKGDIHIGTFPAASVHARGLIGCSLSQEKSFYLRLSGRRNLEFFAALKSTNRGAARTNVDEIVEELEIADIVATRVDRCSSGMVQQLGFARALLGAPRLVMLDEPTRSMDDAAIDRLWAALDRRPDVAVLMASHRSEDLARCDRVLEFPT